MQKKVIKDSKTQVKFKCLKWNPKKIYTYFSEIAYKPDKISWVRGSFRKEKSWEEIGLTFQGIIDILNVKEIKANKFSIQPQIEYLRYNKNVIGLFVLAFFGNRPRLKFVWELTYADVNIIWIATTLYILYKNIIPVVQFSGRTVLTDDLWNNSWHSPLSTPLSATGQDREDIQVQESENATIKEN